MNKKAVVVFSGGQDSTTCLFWALEKFDEVIAVTFNYNQKHKLEIECAKNIAKDLGVEHHILDMGLLNQLAPNALTRDDIEIKMGENGAPPSTFVEGRNMLFLTFAGVLAKVKGAKHIVTGVCETDFSGYQLVFEMLNEKRLPREKPIYLGPKDKQKIIDYVNNGK